MLWLRALFIKRLSVDEEIAKKKKEEAAAKAKPSPAPPAPLTASPRPRLLTTAELLKYHGKPGDPNNHVKIQSPFPLVIAWLPKEPPITTLSVHKHAAKPLLAWLNDILLYYGYDKRVVPDRPTIKELGIDQFGGLGNYRAQRGLEKKYNAALKAGNAALAYSYLSRHAWWLAIDLDPARNQLKETSRTARFARPEYKYMIDSAYRHGFISYGIERNNDWMHFEYGLTG